MVEEECEDLQTWKERAKQLRDALDLDSYHWQGVVTRAREMFRFLQKGRLDLLGDADTDDTLFVKLPTCPNCGEKTKYVHSLHRVVCHVCNWSKELLFRDGPAEQEVIDLDKEVVHELKTWSEPFEAVSRGHKQAELRDDDRDPVFSPGHVLLLKEWKPDLEEYTGNMILARVQSVYRHESAVPEGKVLMMIKIITVTASAEK